MYHYIRHPKFAKHRDMNMTEGPLLRKVIVFVLPLMLTNILQMLYSSADMVIVGLSSESDAVGAIGTTGAMINLILNIFIGFSVGANVVVANRIGANDSADKISETVHTSITMSLMFGIAGCAIGLVVSRPILAAMGNTGKLLELADLYTKIYFLGVPLLSVTNYAIAILRAKGDTKTPLYILTLTGILNVGLNLLFVLAFGMSVDGVAWATLISSGVSAFFLLLRLARDNGPCRFSVRKLRIERTAFFKILYVGIPAGVQGALFSISNMLIQSSILKVNSLMCPDGGAYQPVVKGNASAGNLEGFAYTATNSVYQASVTFTSQNTGAKKYERIGTVMRCCYFVTFCISVISAGLLLILRTPLLSLYGVSDGIAGSLDAIAYNAGISRMIYILPTYFTLAFMEVGSGILRGMGRSVTSTVVSLIGSCLFRIVWIYAVFESHQTLLVIYLSYPISWTLTAAAHFICSMVVKRKLMRGEKHPASQTSLPPTADKQPALR